ncbi:MAG: hypothetical protein PHP73_01590 [Candidatus Omnitrophica bacterium]|nr:hypothetical protein [Candidatus Omnitrophota bacterium]
MKRSDFSNKEWDNIKNEIKIILIEMAKRRGLITYSDLTKRINAVRLNTENKDEVQIMAQLLGELSCEESRVGHGMISTLVIHKTGDQEPGLGFFDYAKEIGKDFNDKTKFWVEECKKVHNYWAVKSKVVKNR